MLLDNRQASKSSRMRQIILEYSEKIGRFPTGCGHCASSGLKGVYKNGSTLDFSWTGEYCDFCTGVGYSNEIQEEYLKKFGLFICKECNGVGCKKCKDRGYVDWVENIYCCSR